MAKLSQHAEPREGFGAGLEAPHYSPKDPQAFLQETDHPLSPFTGNAIEWRSDVYDDGTT